MFQKNNSEPYEFSKNVNSYIKINTLFIYKSIHCITEETKHV